MTAPDWQRLDPRTVPAALVRALIPLVPLAVGWLWLGQRDWTTTVPLLVLASLVLIRPTTRVISRIKLRYRLEPTELVVESGLLVRTRRTVPVDRIRTVEITSGAVDRIFGLGVVSIGTGQRAGSDDELVLEGLATPVAEQLRRTLLLRRDARTSLATAPFVSAASPRATSPSSPETSSAEPEQPSTLDGGGASGGESPAERASSGQEPAVVMDLDRRWIRYHLLGVWTLAFPVAALGVGYQGLQLVGADPDNWLGWYVSTFVPSVSPAVWLPLTLAVVLVLGLIGSAAVFTEAWWNHRLVREDADTFVATRGLVTRRSITLERARVRGATLRSTPITRLLRGAKLTPILTGLSTRQEWSESAAVVPTTQHHTAVRVADLLLGTPLLSQAWVDLPSSDDGPWHRHPRAAGRRILLRYSVGTVVVPAVFLAGAAWWWSWSWWWLLVPGAALLVAPFAATRAYRRLGHRLTDTHLWARRGWCPRRTDVVELSGISSAAVSQTIFQRRLGLATVRVGTAAGERVYDVTDVPIGTARRLATALGGRSFSRPAGRSLAAAA